MSELRRFPADGSFVAAAEPGAEFVLLSRSRPPSGLRFRWVGRAPLALATRPPRVFDSRQRRRSAFTHGLTKDQIMSVDAAPGETRQPLVLEGLAGLRERVGTVLGVSDWVETTQDNVDTFAKLTGDEQYIHVDPERAAKGPL